MKSKEDLAAELGTRLIDDADKIRRFMPDHMVTFWFKWGGKRFEVFARMVEETR